MAQGNIQAMYCISIRQLVRQYKYKKMVTIKSFNSELRMHVTNSFFSFRKYLWKYISNPWEKLS